MFSGQYDIVMRELRTILEGAFYHFRYDFELQYYDKTVFEKNNIMENNTKVKDTYGKEVFKKSGYNNWNIIYKDIYRKLSYYVHSGLGRYNAMRVNDAGYNGPLDTEFDLNKITKCLAMLKKVVLIEVELMEILLQKVYGIEKNEASFQCIFEDII
ncbi:MAG: hypothetical protein CVU98_06930 [Firmicutes bacterium HGW-Firmicutes-3]|nr:MAG: hypothetical protein CVU98_06930 [Firmicutes bacterium HGW-Firmicutes-3]